MSDTESSSRHRSSWWPFCTMVIVAVLATAFLIYHYSPIRAAGSAADKALEGAKDLVRQFTEKNITTTFQSKLISLADTNGGLLEVAKLESMEDFRREASTTLRGTTVTEARAMAVYKFHVPLRDGWRIDVEESGDVRACFVVAPALAPSLPVAFKSDELETRSSEGWLRWDEKEEMAALLAQITPELNRRAHKNVAAARETARKTIKDFVRTWLFENGQWGDDRFSVIDVKFADEVEEEGATEAAVNSPSRF